MSDGADLYNELSEKNRLLDRAVTELRDRGRKLAQAERDYRVALRSAILEERADGVPVTIISDICRGREDIARLRLERDAAETMYRSAIEAIQIFKLQAKLIENQIAREMGQASRM